jgi:T-complex protein 11
MALCFHPSASSRDLLLDLTLPCPGLQMEPAEEEASDAVLVPTTTAPTASSTATASGTASIPIGPAVPGRRAPADDGDGGPDSPYGSPGSTATLPPPPQAPSALNEQMAHELMLDPGFRFKGFGESTTEEGASGGADSAPAEPKLSESMADALHRQVHEAARKAFFDAIGKDLSATPPQYTRVLSAVEELRNMIASLTPRFVHESSDVLATRTVQEIL